MHATTMNVPVPQDASRFKKLLGRLGIAGFAFFFLKGMLWLLIPAAIAWFRG